MEILDALTDVLVNKFDVETELIRPDATFETLDLDSLSQVEFGATLQKRFGVPISDTELQAVETLADIQQLITAKL